MIHGVTFEVFRPNTAWVSDITYIPTDEGWLYLAGHKDLFTGELVGYAMEERTTKNLVSQSLFRATEYTEVFYNRQRRQKRLGYLSPVAYEQRFYAGQLAA